MKKLLSLLITLLFASAVASAKHSNDSTFITHCDVTIYKPKHGAKTASGEVVNHNKIKSGEQRIVAISRDLLWAIPLHSIIEIEKYGRFNVKDTMGKGVAHGVDILVLPTEKNFKEKNIKIKVIRKGLGN